MSPRAGTTARLPLTVALVCVLAVAVRVLLVADAQDTATAEMAIVAAAAAGSSSNTSTSSADTEEAATRQALVEWYKRQYKENETQLVGFPSEELQSLMPWGERPCRDFPSVQTRSTTYPTNNGCPALFNATGASCTCLIGYVIHPESWEFKVKKKTAMKTLPLNLRSTDTFEIDAISTLWVNKTLTSLRIIGVSDEPLPIQFISDNRDKSSNDLPIARSSSSDFNLQTLGLYNIDLDDVIKKTKGFIPTTVTNLTMQNCNFKEVGIFFVEGLANVEYLDLSHNRLPYTYAGKRINNDCYICSVIEVNLSYNEIINFTEDLFELKSLQKLYMHGNKLNLTVSSTIFQGIQNLQEFTADPSVETTCDSGKWQIAHDVKFCVLGALNAGVTSPDSKDQANDYLLYVSIGGGGMVLILLFFVVREKWWKAREESFKEDEHASIFADTYDFDDSHGTLNAHLMNDPLLVTNRIEYSELKIGQCISKGGFGLVFVGQYNGRKVAVKKIRPDLSDDMSQIELFLKEIALMATLAHPRIVEFVGVAWDSLRHLSAVTEFMERGDLRDVLHGFKERGCRLTWENHKTHISLHIAEALTYLHSLRPKKVIHRDLKSKNVLMNADMEAKLSDFGISRERRFEETHMTAGIGTSFWIAPEVLLGHDYDERADIFSFGVVLCEIDTDDYPYWNDKNPQQGGKLQQAEILRQVAAGALRPTFTDDCSKAILDLADSCLQVNPKDRPSAAEIVYELQRIQRGSSSSSDSSG